MLRSATVSKWNFLCIQRFNDIQKIIIKKTASCMFRRLAVCWTVLWSADKCVVVFFRCLLHIEISLSIAACVETAVKINNTSFGNNNLFTNYSKTYIHTRNERRMPYTKKRKWKKMKEKKPATKSIEMAIVANNGNGGSHVNHTYTYNNFAKLLGLCFGILLFFVRLWLQPISSVWCICAIGFGRCCYAISLAFALYSSPVYYSGRDCFLDSLP